ncbi:MAG: uroporphyrinogen-III synthase [Terracidiphilus sp.]
MSSLPLTGKRVLVTRSAHQAGKLSEGLRAQGATPVEVPVLEIRPPQSFLSLDQALLSLANYDWLILTSANTVDALIERAQSKGAALDHPSGLKVAAVGEATASAARAAGFKVTFTPVSYVAESLVDGLKGSSSGEKILLARAEVSRDVIPDALRAAGAQVDVVDAYRNVMPEAAPEQLRQALADRLDAVTFTSSSSVTHLFAAARAARVPWPFDRVPAISIGPITSATLRESGWEPAAEASKSDVPGLVEAVAQLLGRGSL